jgi:hypothetical protein
MGRPLNKKYFGNRNIGRNGREGFVTNDYNPPAQSNETNTQFPDGDDGIGGKGIGSFTSIVAGSGWTTDPIAYINTPSLPGGVQAQITAHYKALSFATVSNGTGYSVGNNLEVTTGTASTKARAQVASIVTVGIPGITNGGSQYDLRSSQNDRVEFTHANLSTSLIVQVETVSGSTVTGISVVQAGVWNGPAAPTSMANGVGGFTATTIAGFPGGDSNGSGLVLNFPSNVWGVYSFGAVIIPGDYTGFPATGTDGLLTNVSGSGTGARATITMGLLSVTVNERGSGYIDATDDALLRFDGSANGASAVTVFAADTGAPGTATNQENAIIAYVWQDGERRIADIVKQYSSRRYVFIANDGYGKEDEAVKGKLVPRQSQANDEADITAYDSDNNEYWVTKITAHKALLTRKISGNGQFESGTSVKWTFDNAEEDYSVKLQNA